jgi:hypothetical protein
MKGKNLLSAEEIKAQIVLELPDRFSKQIFYGIEICPGNLT